jgi:hypothetical protein
MGDKTKEIENIKRGNELEDEESCKKRDERY